MTERVITSACELRLGDWQNVLADVEQVDALIVDAPYSERTHAGHDYASRERRGLDGPRRALSYTGWSAQDVDAFVFFWSARTTGWFVTITDHVLAPAWMDALAQTGRNVFYPLPFIETGSRVRLCGDGPSSWTCWLIVARPRSAEFARWGTLPGVYIDTTERKPVVGGKPLGLMRALVRDYTRPGDLICDPCAGGATTLLAAAHEGRRAIGAERDAAHFEIARKRLSQPITPPLFVSGAQEAEQSSLWGDE